MTVRVGGVENGQPIPVKFAYCIPNGKGQTQNGSNINPAISWSGAPQNTRSYALIVVDKDVPASFELANKEGKTIPAGFPRRDFYHWVLVDIPTSVTSIAEGGGKSAQGVSGKNDYPGTGYDGPCPPWNDERLHHYHFVVYALDVPSLGLVSGFGGKEAEAAMSGHVLAKGEVIGTYANNPAVK
ncbi:MAG: YbhB/YbcL family Raf kinase inhibitor-like protein [Pseudomonadota bacterium]|nr:YbhB/YbcL family Raf kinase inhibitor-like protein [Pseudomonadota bacterium]